jgi:hypothetical protein
VDAHACLPLAHEDRPVSCQRTAETDFAAFAAERRAPEFAALRDHYPRCRACAGEVARWSRLLARCARREPV